MSWWLQLDATLFRVINSTLKHPLLDAVMPFFAWNKLFVPALIFAIVWLLWKGGTRGRLFVLMAAVVIGLGDAFVINTIKHAVMRPRPFFALEDINLLVGRGRSSSMPSSHASSWFAATVIAFFYFRQSWKLFLPVAVLIAFSRVYVGAHFPSDVIAGALLGSGYAVAGVYGIHLLWNGPGRKWFPAFWARMPFLVPPQGRNVELETGGRPTVGGQEWLRLGYLVIGITLLARLVYIGSGEIELSEDEAYQWTWSKHLALSYYSKPPLIAYTQFLGTTLWGDTEFGVRFFSPILGALLSALVLRFVSRTVNARTGFLLLLATYTTPLLAVGATVMTVDPLLVFFWTAGMIAGWNAMLDERRTGYWLLSGLCLGLGLMSKYTALFQIVCWSLFFAIHRPARTHLRRAGPYLGLVIALLCAIPMLIWNAQHGWITARHVAVDNAELNKAWQFKPLLPLEFLGAEAGLWNPVFFACVVLAVVGFWRMWRSHNRDSQTDPFPLLCLCMGAPVFIGYLLFSFRTRVLPNWVAPAILPLFCFAAWYWHKRWEQGFRSFVPWLKAGLLLGAVTVIVLHDTDIISKLAGSPLPPKVDPLRRVRGWKETTQFAEAARRELLQEGKETFLIGSHYGITGLLTFYLPEAKAAVQGVPLVYYRTTDRPKNQFYFWPGYRTRRTGQNAIYVDEVRRGPEQPPEELVREFESVTDLGVQEVKYRGRVLRRIQLFACRSLRP